MGTVVHMFDVSVTASPRGLGCGPSPARAKPASSVAAE
jgi:hypothetical protein